MIPEAGLVLVSGFKPVRDAAPGCVRGDALSMRFLSNTLSFLSTVSVRPAADRLMVGLRLI